MTYQNIFFFFFHANCLQHFIQIGTICMICQNLFSGKNKKNIINMLSAEIAHRVVRVTMKTTNIFFIPPAFLALQLLLNCKKQYRHCPAENAFVRFILNHDQKKTQRLSVPNTHDILTFTTLLANSADNKLTFFLFFPENRIWHFPQTVSTGDNLHEMSNPVSWEK